MTQDEAATQIQKVLKGWKTREDMMDSGYWRERDRQIEEERKWKEGNQKKKST